MTPIDKTKSHYSIKANGLIKFNVKDVDTVSRTVCFVGNTYNFLDSDKDVLMPGACAESIKARGVDSSAPDKIVHALFHDLTRLPGKLKVLDERKIDGYDCLYCESKLTDTVDGTDTLKNYLAEIYNQHSIGYNYSKYEWLTVDAHGNSKKWENMKASLVNPDDLDGVDYVRNVSKIDLWEISTLAFGANKLTPALGMKTINKDVVMLEYFTRLDKLERALKSGTQSDDMMHLINLQFLQLKQSFTEIFGQFKMDDSHEYEECDKCKNKVKMIDGKCPTCEELSKAADLSFNYSKFNELLIARK